MTQDQYEGFAERYDWMKKVNTVRQEFFRQLFAIHSVGKLLDCACGTGLDLLMFHSLGLEVSGDLIRQILC
jgi:ubiquinone/menaquinone biosynthesis C-methylase UbiE